MIRKEDEEGTEVARFKTPTGKLLIVIALDRGGYVLASLKEVREIKPIPSEDLCDEWFKVV